MLSKRVVLDSDAVALFPAPPEDTTRMIDLTASEVLPKVMGP